MVSKKTMFFVIIALVLLIVAVSLRILDSKEVPTSEGTVQENTGDGKVGVTILPTNIEDKMAGKTTTGEAS